MSMGSDGEHVTDVAWNDMRKSEGKLANYERTSKEKEHGQRGSRKLRRNGRKYLGGRLRGKANAKVRFCHPRNAGTPMFARDFRGVQLYADGQLRRRHERDYFKREITEVGSVGMGGDWQI
jgi:hypothetical protein